MTTERVKCPICSSMILPTTAQINDGLCAQCVKIRLDKRNIVATVYREKDPLGRAIELYLSLIDSLAAVSTDRDFGAFTDPEITVARLYTPTTYTPQALSSFPFCDEASEVGSETVDDIEHYLLAATTEYSLLEPIANKLRSVSLPFNANGKTIFLSSTGMGIEEIAWLIRYINDKPTFERFLSRVGLTEEQVDVYNDAYYEELN